MKLSFFTIFLNGVICLLFPILSGFFKICLIFRKSLPSRVKFFYFLKKFIKSFIFNYLLDFLKWFDFYPYTNRKLFFPKISSIHCKQRAHRFLKFALAFLSSYTNRKLFFFQNPLQSMINKHLTELLWNRLAFMTHSLPILTENTFL